MRDEGFDIDLVLAPRQSERRAWIVAGCATGVAVLLAIAFAAALPFKTTEVVTVLVDRHTGDVEKVMKVAPTGIADTEAVKEALLVGYVTDRESYFEAGLQKRLEAVLRKSTGEAAANLQALWSSGKDNADYPPRVYGAGAEVQVVVKRITFLQPNVAQVRFEKTLTTPHGSPVTRAFVATVQFKFDPKTERSLTLVWENPLGFVVQSYRVDAETVGASN